MVGVLRDRREPPAVAPEFGIANIEGLAAGAGPLRVDVELHGDLADLSPALEAAVYRVAQESVTNARRHAQQATRVEVNVAASRTAVHVTVTDDGARKMTAGPRRLRFGGDDRAGHAARGHAHRGTETRPGLERPGQLPTPGGGPVTVRVLIADDQSIVRAGLSTILNGQPDIEVVGRPPTDVRPSTWPVGYVPTCASSTYGCRSSTASKPHGYSPAQTSTIRSPSW